MSKGKSRYGQKIYTILAISYMIHTFACLEVQFKRHFLGSAKAVKTSVNVTLEHIPSKKEIVKKKDLHRCVVQR